MKINKMTSYAIRIIGRMYVEQNAVLTSKQIAGLESIPQGMVMKEFRKLKDAGIVESKQGRGEVTGGFALKKDVKKITIYHLVRAMEDGVCLYPDFEKRRYNGRFDVLYDELKRTHSVYIEELKRHSLYELLK